MWLYSATHRTHESHFKVSLFPVQTHFDMIRSLCNFAEQTLESLGCCPSPEDVLVQSQTNRIDYPRMRQERLPCFLGVERRNRGHRGALRLQLMMGFSFREFRRRKRSREVSDSRTPACSWCDSVGLRTYCSPPGSSFTLISGFLISRLHLSGLSIVISILKASSLTNRLLFWIRKGFIF